MLKENKLNNNVILFVILLVLGLVVYQNALLGPFVYDDHFFIEHNPSIRDLSIHNIVRFFTDPAHTVAFVKWNDIYRPLRTLSFALDYSVWGLNPFGYHLTNLLLHIFNAFLLMQFLKRFFKNIDAAFFAALIFLVHPLQTEAVSWISSRSDVMFLFFYLIALLLYLKHLDRLSSGKSGLSFFLTSIGVYIVALLSKEMAITFPLTVFAYELLFRQEVRFYKRIVPALKRGVPFYLIAVIYCVLWHFLLNRVSQREWWGGSPLNNFLSIPKAFFVYCRLLFLSVRQSLEHTVLPSSGFAEPATLYSLAGLILVFLLLIYLLAKRHYVPAFGFLWFFISCLPVANIIPLNTLVSERFMYLPIIGFAIIMATAADGVSRVTGKNYLIAAPILFCFVFIAVLRNYDWQDEERLWLSTVKSSPENYKAHFCLGDVYEREGKLEEAVAALNTSLKYKADYAPTHYKLGHVYQKLGLLDKAVVYYQNVLIFSEASPITNYNLGIVYGSLGEYDKAKKCFENVIRMQPSNAQAHYNLAVTLKALNDEDVDKIKEHLKKADEYGYKYPSELEAYLITQESK